MQHASRAFCLGVACIWLAAAVELIELHGPDGQRAYVNTHEISSLREPTASDLASHFHQGTHCVVVTTNGKFLAVSETCSAILNILSGKHQ